MAVDSLTGNPAPAHPLLMVPRLAPAWHAEKRDRALPAERVAFGTSGHRGVYFKRSFNEAHILARAPGHLARLQDEARRLVGGPLAGMRILLAVFMLSALPAQAVGWGLQAGALEVVVLPPAHGGFHPYIGGSVAVPLGAGFTFIGSLSLAWTFELARGGLMAVTTLDYALSDRVGLDLNVSFVHEQPGLRFLDSAFFVGGGLGLSFPFGRWVLSPFFSVLKGLNVPVTALVPGLNVTCHF